MNSKSVRSGLTCGVSDAGASKLKAKRSGAKSPAKWSVFTCGVSDEGASKLKAKRSGAKSPAKWSVFTCGVSDEGANGALICG